MKKQLDLLGYADLEIEPDVVRSEPRFWVGRLVIWNKPGVVLREIRLRPGLNIIWAPDPADRASTLDEDAIVGHGSGKTLFCRLLRYCLGEDRFAPDEQRDRIVQAFPEGRVGAEVVIDGIKWSVIRPIGTGRHHFAVKNVDLDQAANGSLTATGIEPFLDAIAASFLLDDLVRIAAGDRSRDVWLSALAWLSRDQECRFDKPLDWRSADSNSGSLVRNLSVQQLLDTLRALIRAIVPEEYALRAEIRKLENDHGKANRDINRTALEVDRIRSRLIKALHLDHEELLPGRMAVDPLRTSAKSNLARLVGVNFDADVANLDALRSETDIARKRINDLEKNLSVLEAQEPEIQSLIRRIEGELPVVSARAYNSKHLICPICEVPVDRTLAEGCKLSHKLPNLTEIRERLANLQKEQAQEQNRLRKNHSEQARITRALKPAREHADILHKRLRATEHARDTRVEDWFKARQLIVDVERLNHLLNEQEQAQVCASAIGEEIETKRGRAGAFRDAQGNVFNKLSRFFNAIIREVVGTDATGTISLDGNGLRSSVELGGERTTAAIESLKVIAFDLAVMCMSIEGRTHLPAFLIHDSPREADLGLSVYQRLFYFTYNLETATTQPLFQYIVTTTTSPPDELRKEPWLSETLGGVAAKRLMKRDL